MYVHKLKIISTNYHNNNFTMDCKKISSEKRNYNEFAITKNTNSFSILMSIFFKFFIESPFCN